MHLDKQLSTVAPCYEGYAIQQQPCHAQVMDHYKQCCKLSTEHWHARRSCKQHVYNLAVMCPHTPSPNILQITSLCATKSSTMWDGPPRHSATAAAYLISLRTTMLIVTDAESVHGSGDALLYHGDAATALPGLKQYFLHSCSVLDGIA